MPEYLSQLKGSVVIDVLMDEEDPETIWGLRLQRPDGMIYEAWILSDAEGNGPGFLNIING